MSIQRLLQLVRESQEVVILLGRRGGQGWSGLAGGWEGSRREGAAASSVPFLRVRLPSLQELLQSVLQLQHAAHQTAAGAATLGRGAGAGRRVEGLLDWEKKEGQDERDTERQQNEK
jgi:hypothetical protein